MSNLTSFTSFSKSIKSLLSKTTVGVKITYTKSFEQYLIHSKHLININIAFLCDYEVTSLTHGLFIYKISMIIVTICRFVVRNK